ncbi:MAG: hypothetical protein U0031_20655 [Thermomicrobiales bacterium]
MTASPATQTPPRQTSPLVHGLPSSQEVPSAFAGFVQAPVLGLQTPASWHWSEAVQSTGSPPTQVPFWQVSDRVQASPSSQEAPLGLAA